MSLSMPFSEPRPSIKRRYTVDPASVQFYSFPVFKQKSKFYSTTLEWTKL